MPRVTLSHSCNSSPRSDAAKFNTSNGLIGGRKLPKKQRKCAAANHGRTRTAAREMANAAAAAASGAAEAVENSPFTAEQVAMLVSMLQAHARSSAAPQTGCCLANQQESQRLSDMKRLKPTRGSRYSMPSFVLHQLPLNPQELYIGNIPLVPVLPHMAVSTALQRRILDKSPSKHMI
mgnify:CR=1 FL=1